MTRVLGMELLPLVKRVLAALDTESDLVKRQQAIELITAQWAQGFDNKAEFVADSMHKHVRQILKQWRET